LFEVFAISATTNVTSTLPTATTAAITGLTTGGLIPFGGSALVGYIIGFAIKKIIKWLLIGLGVLAGLIFLAVQWMANNGYIQGVKWDKLGNDISSYGQHLATQIDFNNLSGVFHWLGVPMTSGLVIGALVGFVRTR
jgi:uncharacterized membrane protein (Fun14 family)